MFIPVRYINVGYCVRVANETFFSRPISHRFQFTSRGVTPHQRHHPSQRSHTRPQSHTHFSNGYTHPVFKQKSYTTQRSCNNLTNGRYVFKHWRAKQYYSTHYSLALFSRLDRSAAVYGVPLSEYSAQTLSACYRLTKTSAMGLVKNAITIRYHSRSDYWHRHSTSFLLELWCLEFLSCAFHFQTSTIYIFFLLSKRHDTI